MAITMDGIYVNGHKVTFAPEDILSTDPSAYTEQIGEAVEEWLEENVTGGEQVTDTTLTLPGVPADSKKTGDEIGALKEDLKALGVCDIGTNADLSFYDNVNRLNVSIKGDIIITDGMTGGSSYANLDGTPSKISGKANAPKNFSLVKGHYYTFNVEKISGSYGDHDDYVMFYVTDGTKWLARIKATGGSVTFSPKSNMNVSVLFYVRYGTSVSNLQNRLSVTEYVRHATYEELTKADVYSESIVDGSLISGMYADNTGEYNNDRLDYVCTQGATAITPGSILKIKISSAFALSTHVVFYDSNNSRVSNTNVTIAANGEAIVNVPSTAYYFNISLSYSYGYTLNPDDYSIIVTASDKYSIKEKISVYENNYDFNVIGPWSNNIYTFGTAVWYKATNRIGLKNIITSDADIVVTADSGYSFSVGEFSSTIPAVANEICYTGWISSYLLQAGKHYLINMRKNDNSNISPDNVIYNNHLHFRTADFTTAQNYMILGLRRFPVYLERIGVLPDGLQAFCKYDGKYYSTDGEHIFVISDAFALENTVDLDVGHGNSFQLGSSNLAYISGWDDNKVYCVDMDTLTLDSTITLPTTGYTTVAIDDINKLAYIFQRDTSPTTETIYNFIVYDYDNSQTISTKKITKAFGGMQACDFVDGQIFVVNGLYNTAVPNGYRVYNTNGDIIAEYVFNSITTEPEGVFFDRTTRELLVSDSVKNVYSVH